MGGSGGGSSGSYTYHELDLEIIEFLLGGEGLVRRKGQDQLVFDVGSGTVSEDDTYAIDGGLIGKLNTYTGNNPFVGENAVDPNAVLSITSTSPLGVMKTVLDNYEAEIDAFDSDSDVDARVQTYKFNAKEDLNEVENRFAARMYEINAVNSSQFELYNAVLTSRYLNDIDSFRAKISNEYKAVALTHERFLAALRIDVQRFTIGALVEQTTTNLDYDFKEATWDLSVYREISNVLASAKGGVSSDIREPNKLKSGLLGAAAGGVTMAMLGAEGGVLAGTALGGGTGIAAGAIVGGLAGLL